MSQTIDISKGKGTISFGEESEAVQAHRLVLANRDNRMNHVYTCVAIIVILVLAGFSANMLMEDKDNAGAWSVLSAPIGIVAGFVAGRKIS